MKSYSERITATREKIESYKNKAKLRRKKIIFTAVSLCSCLLIAFNIVIFYPQTNNSGGINSGPNGSVSGDDGNSYGEIVKQINAMRKNNDYAEVPGDDSVEPGAGGNSSSSGDQLYNETTDNQVAGVIEGDLLKRTDEYIYYLAVPSQYYGGNPPMLRIYPINGPETKCVAEFTVVPQDGYVFGNDCEMYLNGDGTAVTLVLTANCHNHYNQYTEVINIDVSDFSDIKITEKYSVSGRCVSSRLVNEELLLVTNFSVPYNADLSDEKQFIPATGASDEMRLIPAKKIHCPEKPSGAYFTVVSSVNAATLKETGCEAFLSYSGDVYVSENNIYLISGYNAISDLLEDVPDSLRGNGDYHYVYEHQTEIARVDYGNKLEYKDSFTLKGLVKDRYCIDEKDGVLRAVTSLHRYEYGSIDKKYSYSITNGASLYCIDVNSHKTVGKLENFAPEEDSVMSARFDGDKVYVCTAAIADPVFVIDISDYNDIRSVDTGEIPGYSVALRKFYGGTLLGIGYGGQNDWMSRLKIELYKETNNSVEPVAVFFYSDDGLEYNGEYYKHVGEKFSEDYKTYFIDEEMGLIGLGFTANYCSSNTSVFVNRYILLQYDGEALDLLLDIELDGETAEKYYFYEVNRAVYVDGAFYVFTENGFSVTELNI